MVTATDFETYYRYYYSLLLSILLSLLLSLLTLLPVKYIISTVLKSGVLFLGFWRAKGINITNFVTKYKYQSI